jgi:ABC-2 type transport system permease protein
MKKFWIIFASEYAQVVKKKSFLIGIILTPAMMILITVLPAMLMDKGISAPESYVVIDADGRGIGAQFASSLERYKLDSDSTVGAYKLVHLYEIPDNRPQAMDSVRSILDSMLLTKQLKHYVVLLPRLEESDSVLMVSKSTNFKTSARFDRRISDILAAMRLEKSNINISIDSVLSMTRRVEMSQVSPGGKTRDFTSMYFGALVFVMIVVMSVLGFGGILMRSIIEEKNSRVMEVLISSVSPFQLMMGKIAGLGFANLTQVGIWVVIGLLLFANRSTLNIPANVGQIIFNPVLIVFFVIYLIIAYIMYSAMFAFIGSICSTDKETQNFMFPVTMSILLPIFIMTYIVQEPESLPTTILSLIPVFTPTMMILRINIMAPETFSPGNPVVLEALIGVGLSVLFTIGMVWVTGRVFRMGILMTGKRATFPEILKWIRYK